VNRIYRGDPISQLSSCRFAQPSVLNRPLFNADDEIQEVVDSNTTSEQNTGVVVASTSNSDDPAATTTEKKISCPICLDDEKTVSKILTLIRPRLYTVLNKLSHSVFFFFFWPRTKSPLNGRKPENNSLLR